MEAFGEPREPRAKGEWIALGALLLPWIVLSLMLPVPELVLAVLLLVGLGALVGTACVWSRLRAEELGLDAEAWGLAAVLTLGYSMLLLLGTKERSGFEAMCMDCGRISDARTTFCYGCGSYGA